MQAKPELLSRLALFVVSITCVAHYVCSNDPPPNLIGVFHVPNVSDAINISINDDRTFHWELDGCDTFFDGGGSWETDGDSLTLIPSSGDRELFWPFHPLVFRVTDVRVSDGGQRGEEIRVVTSDVDGTIREQVWQKGRVCPVCGLVGPEELRACDGPL